MRACEEERGDELRNLRIAGALAGLLLVAGVSVAVAAPAAISNAEVIAFGGDGPDPAGSGTAQLVRTSSGVSASIHTNNLPPGAYTVWWVIFNTPGGCSDGVCGEDDVFSAPGVPDVGGSANPSVARATGKVVGPNGLGNFGASLGEGDTSEALFGPGLVDTSVAEIHMIIRYHGPVVAGFMPAMILSLGGGCSEATGGGVGAVGFDCFDPQALAFPLPTP